MIQWYSFFRILGFFGSFFTKKKFHVILTLKKVMICKAWLPGLQDIRHV